MFKRLNGPSDGFTLTELLIVILIIGILAAIAIPIFLSQTANAERASLESDLANAMTMLTTSEALGYSSLPSSFPNTSVTTVPGVGTFEPSDSLTRVGSGDTLCVEGSTPSGLTMSFSQEAGLQEQPCPDAPSVVIEYTDTNFTTGSTAEVLTPTVTGGSGTLTYSVAGSLPTGVSFDPSDGTFTGPDASQWNFLATQVTAGSDHACALSTVGDIWCWGSNSLGQLGQDPGVLSSSSTPVKVDYTVGGWPQGSVEEIDAGNQFTCARFTDGSATCWGSNMFGTMANGLCGSPDEIICFPGGEGYEWDISFPYNLEVGWVDLSATSNTVCGLLDTDEIYCWGENQNGQGGSDPVFYDNVLMDPYLVYWDEDPQPTSITQVATGGEFSAALMADGSVYAWGKVSDGSTYTLAGNSAQHNSPVLATPLADSGEFVTQLTAGFNSMCGVTATGGAVCWGDNDYGQLGNGTTTGTYLGDAAVSVTGLSTGVTEIQSSEYSTCALTSAGAVKCWGANQFGQLGNNSTTDSSTPVQVVNLTSGVTTLGDMASIHYLADTERAGTAIVIKDDGKVETWGEGDAGQLGNGATSNSTIPVPVTDSGPTSGFPSPVTVTVVDSAGGSGTTSFNLSQN